MKGFNVTITSSDIKGGIPGSARSCALARSLQRRFPLATVVVGSSTAKVREWDKFSPVQFLLSPRAIEFVRHFDGNLPVRPP